MSDEIDPARLLRRGICSSGYGCPDSTARVLRQFRLVDRVFFGGAVAAGLRSSVQRQRWKPDPWRGFVAWTCAV
jgi:hypothetical protein